MGEMQIRWRKCMLCDSSLALCSLFHHRENDKWRMGPPAEGRMEAHWPGRGELKSEGEAATGVTCGGKHTGTWTTAEMELKDQKSSVFIHNG